MIANKNLLNRSRLRDVLLVCVFASAPFWSVSEALVILGFFVLALGCFLHLVAKAILIRNSVVSDRGIYRVVRHPYYLANYLVDSSFCLLSGNYLLVLIYPFLFFWSYGPTIRKEEALLTSLHGDKFARYVSKVPQIFPDESSIKHLRHLFEGFSYQRLTWKECGRLTRFCSTGIFITLVHDVTAQGLSRANLFGTKPYLTDHAAFFFVAVIMYIVSTVFIALSKWKRQSQ